MTGMASKLDLLGLAHHSTDELMRLVQLDDAFAFEELYIRMAPVVHRFLANRAGAAIPIEDAIQEVFCRIWERRGHFAYKSTVNTYLFSIALNVGREYRRRGERTLYDPFEESADHIARDPAERDSELLEFAETLTDARLTLSERQSEAIGLIYDEGMKAWEAAQRLGCTEKALRRRLDEARRKLRKYFAPLVDSASRKPSLLSSGGALKR